LSRRLRVLIVDDTQNDAALLVNKLRRGGFDPVYEVVNEATSMRLALEKQAWDIVIAEYELPQFNGLAALKLLKKTGFNLPFIVVLRATNEDLAMSVMKAGANAYLVKDNLTRLVPVVERELQNVAGGQEHRWAEEVLPEGDETFRAISDNALDIIAILDADGLIRFVSPTTERFLGHPPQKLLGRNFSDLINLEDLPHILKVFEAIIQEPDGIQTAEFRVQHHDGSWRVIEAVCRNLIGDPIMQGIMINIRISGPERTEVASHSSEERLRQSQKMEALGRLAGAVAHDFSNILTVITGHTELLLHRYLTSHSQIRDEIEQIKIAAERAISLTRQLMAFSSRQVLPPNLLDLNLVVNNLDDMLQRLIGENIELDIILGRQPGHVEADLGQIEQVILNLVINARDAMPYGGKLTIETKNVELSQDYAGQQGLKAGPYVMLAIGDTGTGMEVETQARIFEPFFTTKAKDKGTGLGLATVYRIVNQSHGHIRVHSKPGQGTIFKIYLPRVKGTAKLTEGDPSPIEAVQGSETILLVEDEDAVRALARRILLGKGYRVLEARHGQQAVQICKGHAGPIHLLITDVIMPGRMSGSKLAEYVMPLRPEMKVLFMSGYTDDVIAHHGVLEPGLPFLQKPFSSNELVRKVRQVLDTGKL
jgi:two-component system cell cycle sensor histidine kinase/response regulator CckA